jgi:hypothetical protein
MCFSLAWLEQLVIWLIVIAAVIAIIKLLVPLLDSLIGIPIIGQIIMIALWAFVAIAVVILIFGLLSCLLGGSGTLGFPHGLVK